MRFDEKQTLFFVFELKAVNEVIGSLACSQSANSWLQMAPEPDRASAADFHYLCVS